MEHFKDYLPILAALIAIFSAAIFGFVLPKFADFFNERSRSKLKDTLAIKKDLESYGRSVGPEFNEIIDFYANEFVCKELEFIKSDEQSQSNLDRYIHYTFGLVIIIPIICLFVYLAMLGIMHWFGI